MKPITSKSSSSLKDQDLLRQLDEHRLLKTVIDTVPGPVSYISEDGTYLIVNQTVCQQQGLSEQEIIGKKVGFKQESDQFAKTVLSFLNSSETERQSVVELPTQGELRWHLISMKKPENSKGMVTISVDIHRQKQLEIEAEKSRELTEHASRLATLGEMAGGVAHEINNPLAIIGARVEHSLALCREAVPNLNAIIKNLENVKVTAFRIAGIIKGLRQFSRSAEKEPPQKMRLNSIIENTLSLFKEQCVIDGIELIFDPTEINVSVLVQGTQISQVILNLLGNAFDAVQGQPEKFISISLALVGSDRVGITITDSGPGIPKEIREKIMLPFFTTKEVGKGTGLGLSVSKGILEDHGTTLILKEGRPTQFTFSLPIAQPKT